jgi:hypothetical protein
MSLPLYDMEVLKMMRWGWVSQHPMPLPQYDEEVLMRRRWRGESAPYAPTSVWWGGAEDEVEGGNQHPVPLPQYDEEVLMRMRWMVQAENTWPAACQPVTRSCSRGRDGGESGAPPPAGRSGFKNESQSIFFENFVQLKKIFAKRKFKKSLKIISLQVDENFWNFTQFQLHEQLSSE